MSENSSKTQLLVAQWRPGQLWRVEYLRDVPSPAKSTSPRPRPPQRSVWKYQVLEINTDLSAFQVAATEEDGEGRLELWFEGAERRLRRVVKLVADRRTDLVVHREAGPYFGWTAVYPVIFDWPDLPQTKESSKREFVDDDGQTVEEESRFTPPSQHEIQMILRREIDGGYVETIRSSQLWVENNPWWSTAQIETERIIDGDKSVETNISGRLIG
jgi:hypothetical protein